MTLAPVWISQELLLGGLKMCPKCPKSKKLVFFSKKGEYIIYMSVCMSVQPFIFCFFDFFCFFDSLFLKSDERRPRVSDNPALFDI